MAYHRIEMNGTYGIGSDPSRPKAQFWIDWHEHVEKCLDVASSSITSTDCQIEFDLLCLWRSKSQVLDFHLTKKGTQISSPNQDKHCRNLQSDPECIFSSLFIPFPILKRRDAINFETANLRNQAVGTPAVSIKRHKLQKTYLTNADSLLGNLWECMGTSIRNPSETSHGSSVDKLDLGMTLLVFTCLTRVTVGCQEIEASPSSPNLTEDAPQLVRTQWGRRRHRSRPAIFKQ